MTPDDLDRAYAEGFSHGWADAPRTPRSSIPVLLALIVGVVLGSLVSGVVRAAEVRSGPASLDSDVAQRQSAASPYGAAEVAGSNPAFGVTGGAPTPSPTGEISAMMGGTASFVAPKYGPRYLALPGGPGIRVTICGPAACVTRTSTDAGPDLSMQRAGRIADLSYVDFATLCRCSPPSVGLIRVTVEWIGAGPLATPPLTDTAP